MKRARSSGESYYDIEARGVFDPPVTVAIILAVIVLLVCGFYALIVKTDNDSALAHNERMVEFNAKPLEERQIIAEWTEDSRVDPETYLMAEKEIKPLFILEGIYGADGLWKIVLLYLAGLLATLSLTTFISYWHKKNKVYYLCSLPFDKPYGWVLFFCMFIGWPFLLVSYICMRVQNTDAYKARRALQEKTRQEREELAKREKTVVKKLAEDELAEKARALTKPKYPEAAHQALVNFVLKDQFKAYASRAKEAKVRVEQAQAVLQKAGESVRAAQRGLGEARANLAQIEATIASQASRERAEAEWTAIKEARGVSSIKYNRRRQRLEVVIKVRVPYKGELYDFGDYCLVIDGTRACNCKEIRSGVKVNHTSLGPLYHLSGKRFCFGNSLSTIEEYLGNGRYAEAVTLIVECLHSVNNTNDEEQIPNCFRKVSTVEKAERKILLRNKLKFLNGV